MTIMNNKHEDDWHNVLSIHVEARSIDDIDDYEAYGQVHV